MMRQLLKNLGFVVILAAGYCGVTSGEERIPAPQVISDLEQSQLPWHKHLSQDGFLLVRFSAISPDYAAIRPAASIPVVLTRGATAVGAAKSGPDGLAQIGGVRQGIQSLIAMGQDGISSFGVFVGSAAAGTAPTLTEVALVPASESRLVYQLLSRIPQVTSETLGQIIPGEELADLANGGIPLYVLDGDGGLSGRCVRVERIAARAIPEVHVAFIRGEKVLAEAITDEQGKFQVPAGQLTTGFVSVVAYGAGGYAIFGAEIRDSVLSGEVPLLPDGTSPVAFQGGNVPTTINLSSPQSLGLFQQSVQSQFGPGGAGLPGPGGAVAGGSPGGFGGGAGGGGAGGGGGLLGAAGIAVGATAIGIAAANDNNDNRPASPASP